jgi:predicted ArsR family transcriptional regulator
MVLSELRDYLVSSRRAALLDMAHRFDTNPDALRGMLEKLITKGRVRKMPAPEGCGKCDGALMETYEWTGDSHSATARHAV